MGPAAAALLRGAGALMKFGKSAKAASEFVTQLGSDILDLGNKADKTVKKIIHGADLISKRWVIMQDTAFKTARTMAMSRQQALQYNQQLIDSTRELAAQYGVTAKELADFQKSYAEAVGRNVVLSKEQLSNMSALAKITDNTTAQKLVDEFDKVGVGIARATAYTGRLQERAKALGVSPSKATKMMADNIKLAASYSFRNGVNDIEKMSLKAASMRMDMQSIMNATEKFANIENAIGASANIQMLGGSFAREFSNPMGAMYEAKADPAAFQERILRTIEGKGTYDAKTGAVTFDPVTMDMMRELANQLGMSAQELNTSAMASVQNQKVMEEFAKNANQAGFDKHDIEAIKNLSRTNVDEETGRHFVTLLNDGKEEKVFIEDLTKEQLKIAQDSQMTEEGLWNDVADIKTILERVHGRARDTKSVSEAEKGIETWWDAQITNIQDIWMKPISGLYNGISNWLGKQHFSEGGIVKPMHAAMGAIIPGDSYIGDHTPVMANGGEMILNPMQQKSMFNLISSLAVNGGMAYGVNKIGDKMGIKGAGSTMLLANMLGGGETDLKSIIEAHFIKKAIKSINPLKTSIAEVGAVAEDTTKSTSAFKTNWKELTNTLSKDWHKFSRIVSITSKRYFTTGKWGKITSTASNAAGFVGRNTMAAGRWTASTAKTIGEWIGKYTVKPISSGISKSWNWVKGSKLGLATQDKIGAAQLKLLKAKLGYRDLVKPKAQEYSKLIRNLFNDGSKAQASKIASRYGKLGTPEVSMTGKVASVKQAAETAAKEVSTVAKATGRGGKILSGLGKAGKVIGKKIPYIGTALAIGGAVSGMMDASSQYDAQIDKINSSSMSDLEKARAKDRATKEKNANIGGSVGSAAGSLGGMAAGAATGAAIGSVIPVVGTAIGGLLGGAIGAFGGEKLGGILGKGIGSLFGGSEEEKLKEEKKEKLSKYEDSIKSNNDAVKILTSIDNKLSVISGKSIGIRGKALAGPSLPKLDIKQGIGAIAGASLGSLFGPLGMLAGGMLGSHISSKVDALPINGNFMKVIPTKSVENSSNAVSTVGNANINLNVSGTIKLDGGGKTVDFDINKLLDNREFINQLSDIINDTMNRTYNSGGLLKESSRNNSAKQYNTSGN